MNKGNSNITKQVKMTPTFLKASQADQEGALAFMLLSAFGVSLPQMISCCDRMLKSNNTVVIQFCLTAAIQIRGNTTFVGNDLGNIRTDFPEFIIEGDRDVRDVYNFSALHVAGHLLCHCVSDDITRAILKKCGSCITGEQSPNTEAGQINSEMARGWPVEDMESFRVFVTANSAAPVLSTLLKNMRTKSASFQKKLVPASSASSSSSTAGGASNKGS